MSDAVLPDRSQVFHGAFVVRYAVLLEGGNLRAGEVGAIRAAVDVSCGSAGLYFADAADADTLAASAVVNGQVSYGEAVRDGGQMFAVSGIMGGLERALPAVQAAIGEHGFINGRLRVFHAWCGS